MSPWRGGLGVMLAWPIRIISVASILICGAIVSHGTVVRGAPTANQSPEPSPDRGGAFQILADGSQDLAALVGLFATDGVERYTVDYTRGLIPPMTAPLSLLGLLGYVRALLKLSFGVEFCKRTGFSIASLRSYAGVRRSDIAQSDKIVDVQYLQRSIRENEVQWRLVKTVPHTQESMPLIAGDGVRAPQDEPPRDTSFGIAMCRLPGGRSTQSLTFGLCGLFLALSASLSSFPVIMFTSEWTWTRIFATVGLSASVLLGGLPWCLVYIIEHLPFEPCDWYRSDWKNGAGPPGRSADESGQSLSRKNSFAYFTTGDQLFIFDCWAVGVLWMWFTRSASCCAAICITIAYVCQYIELRSASARLSGIWLGLQGFLAVVRIIAWHWAPNILGFSSKPEVRWTDQRNNFFKDSLTELEITLCWVSMSEGPLAISRSQDSLPSGDLSERDRALLLPKWLINWIDNVKLVRAFALAKQLQLDACRSENFHLLRNVVNHWDMPGCVFARWLQLRCRTYGYEVNHVATKRHLGVATWVCRIIQDNDGQLHMIPGISLHVQLSDDTVPPSEVILFSRSRDGDKTIFCFPGGAQYWIQGIYNGVGDIPEECGDMARLAKRSLEDFYRQIAEELWDKMLSALAVLGFAER